MVKCPIGGLPREKRLQAIRHCAKYLDEELRALKFGRVVFVGKSTFKLAKCHVKVNFPLRTPPLPFRSKRNIENFKKGLARIMAIS